MFTVNLKKFFIAYSGLAFLLLFPGFFCYHSLVGLGIIPPLLGGYYGIVVMLVFPLALVSFIYLNKTKLFVDIDVAFFSIVILTLSIILINYALGKPSYFSSNTFIWSLSGLIPNFLAYLLARTIPIDSKLFEYLTIGSLGLMALIVFNNIGDYGMFYLKAQLAQLGGVEHESVATYQGFGRSLVVMGLLSIAMLKNTKQMFIVFLLTVCALFYNGARTEFALFIVTYASLLVFLSARLLKSFVVSMLLLVVVLIFMLNLDALVAVLPENRILNLVDIDSDGSHQAREELERFAWGLIASNPILGDYGGYEVLGPGAFPHNILGAWVNLGLFGFSLYILVFLIIMNGIVKIFNKMKTKTTSERIMFVFSVFTMLALFSAKEYNYVLFGLMVGFYSRSMVSGAMLTKD